MRPRWARGRPPHASARLLPFLPVIRAGCPEAGDREPGAPDQHVRGVVAAVGGAQAVLGDLGDRLGHHADVPPGEGRIPVVAEQHPLAAGLGVGPQRRPQRGVADLEPSMRRRDGRDRPAREPSGVEQTGQEFAREPHTGSCGPQSCGVRSAGQPGVGFRQHVRGRPLEDRQMSGERRDLRHELGRARSRADHRHPPAPQVDVVPPAGAVEDLTGEAAESGQRRDRRRGQLPGRADQHVGLDDITVCQSDAPPVSRLVERRGHHLGAEPDPVAHHGRGVAQVAQDVWLCRVPARPRGAGREGVRVERRRHVARRARIGVVPPHPADLVRPLQHGEPLEPGSAQGQRHAQPAESGTDDDHLGVRCHLTEARNNHPFAPGQHRPRS